MESDSTIMLIQCDRATAVDEDLSSWLHRHTGVVTHRNNSCPVVAGMASLQDNRLHQSENFGLP